MTRLLAVWSALVGATICRHNGHRYHLIAATTRSCARCGHHVDGAHR